MALFFASLYSVNVSIENAMSKGAGGGARSSFTIHGEGLLECTIPVPFDPGDGLDLRSLFPHAVVMINYQSQTISAFPHGTGKEIPVYRGEKTHR